VVIDVSDDFCPWYAGCWRVGADGVELKGDAPGLCCDIRALGSVVSGHFTWSQPACALRVQELLLAGAIAHADAIFFRVRKAPWRPEIFQVPPRSNFSCSG